MRASRSQKEMMQSLRFSAAVLIEREQPIALEVAENLGVPMEKVRDRLWFRTAVADELIRRERIVV